MSMFSRKKDALDLRDAFGQPDCESELDRLKDRYSEFFFDETPFNTPALSDQSYLIVGRRGSGKTALVQFFSFQKQISNARSMEVDEPKLYHDVLYQLAMRTPEPREVVIPHLARIWEYVVWYLIFRFLAADNREMANTLTVEHEIQNGSSGLFDALAGLIVPNDRRATEERLSALLSEEGFQRGKKLALRICAKRPLIVPIDTLEQYNVQDELFMQAVAALIQFAERFNAEYGQHGILLKVFIAGEVFPHLYEAVLLNPLKSVKHPVYLLWRPGDLLRLICWRLYKRLGEADLLTRESRRIKDWEDYAEIHDKVWVPYFGKKLINHRGTSEDTFPYLLRHAQMRPRQLILLCNAISNRSLKTRHFPNFSEDEIRRGVKSMETRLANEVFNAYSSVYPNVAKIVDGLMGCPMVFSGNLLDKLAPETASEWQHERYTSIAFRRLVAELGIVGRVKRRDEKNGFILAEFEYATTERLPLMTRDECVIHPMFYSRLNIEFNSSASVLPLATEHEVQNVLDAY